MSDYTNSYSKITTDPSIKWKPPNTACCLELGWLLCGTMVALLNKRLHTRFWEGKVQVSFKKTKARAKNRITIWVCFDLQCYSSNKTALSEHAHGQCLWAYPLFIHHLEVPYWVSDIQIYKRDVMYYLIIYWDLG